MTAPAPAPAPAGQGTPVEVEPTTGAPVDAVPRRVPVRQPGHRPRRDAPAGDGPAVDEEPSWLPIEEVHWDGTPIRTEEPTADERRASARTARRAVPRVARQRDPLPGLAALLGLSLLVAFFAWVSAEPFWLAVGHGTPGRVVVGDCSGGGLAQRCRGNFTATGDAFVAHGVRISGVSAERSATGTSLAARMTGPGGGTAYVDTGAGLHLRWLLGWGLLLACAAGIARATGTAGLTDRRARRWAFAAAFGGPLLVALGFLAAAF